MAAFNYFPIAQGGAGATIIAAGVAGQRHKILGLSLSLAATGSFRITGPGNLTGDIRGLKDNAITWPTSALPYAETAVGAALGITTIGGAAQGIIAYVTEG